MECSICCETFTKCTRKAIECGSCHEKACSGCFKRYLIESGDISPKCMFCSKEIAYSFTRDTLPVAWINGTYLNQRTTHLMSREKSLLPQSQDDVKDELERRDKMKRVKEIDDQINGLLQRVRDLEETKFLIMRTPSTKRTDKVVTLRRCPKEDCKGFLESDWRCGLCKVKTCSSCGEIKTEDHECDEQSKMTFEMIRRETRPCPQCATPIHKWEGCNQMYCTQCSCMFDYRTGRLETGFFHNPHYFEALQAGTIRPRNGDNGCNMGDRDFMRYLRHLKDQFDTRKLRNLLQLTRHINEVTLPRFQPNTLDDQCRVMRRQYLMEELEEGEWFKKLKMIEKKREKNKEIYQLLELFKDIGNDVIINTGEVFRKLPDPTRFGATNVNHQLIVTAWTETTINVNGEELTPETIVLNGIAEVDRMTDFINTKFKKLEKQFNSVFPHFHSGWVASSSRMIF